MYLVSVALPTHVCVYCTVKYQFRSSLAMFGMGIETYSSPLNSVQQSGAVAF